MLKNSLRAAFITLFIFLIFIYYRFELSEYINVDNINETKNFITGKFSTSTSILIIIVFYIICNLFGFPTMYFSILLGYLYNLETAFSAAWLGMMIGIVFSFINSRYLFKDIYNRKFSSNKFFIKLEKLLSEREFLTVITTRVIFIIPYNIQNYIYGLTKVSLQVYLLGTGIGIIPITFFNVLFGRFLSGR